MRRRKSEVSQAIDFYEAKLATNPSMPRYNQCLAAIRDAQGRSDEASLLYKKAVLHAPGNVMIRNDCGLNLARQGYIPNALQEFKNSLIITDTNPVLHMNMGAVYAQRGDFKEAMEHTKRANHLKPDNPKTLRNLAKIQSITGDTRSALANNMRAIQLEAHRRVPEPNSQVFRAAAVQTIARGAGSEEALELIRAARKIEGKHFETVTSQTTQDIIDKIMQRKGDAMEQIQKEEEAKQEKVNIRQALKLGLAPNQKKQS